MDNGNAVFPIVPGRTNTDKIGQAGRAHQFDAIPVTYQSYPHR